MGGGDGSGVDMERNGCAERAERDGHAEQGAVARWVRVCNVRGAGRAWADTGRGLWAEGAASVATGRGARVRSRGSGQGADGRGGADVGRGAGGGRSGHSSWARMRKVGDGEAVS
jgi:hypothetical protein